MIDMTGAPRIDGLVFRRFEGDTDYSVMSSVGRRSFEADNIDFFETAEDLANDYGSSPDRDPCSEVVIAEVMGEPIAYGRIWTDPGSGGKSVYWHIAHVVPEWRNTNLRLAMLRFNEKQIISMAEGKERRGPLVCEVWALDEQNDWREMVVAEGYRAVMHFYEMVRRSLDDIPDAPFPNGLELRPAKPEDYPKIWNASKEAFRGKPWFVEALYDKKYYDSWRNSPAFQPDLWRVAWDGDEVAGMARNEISVDQNREFGRSRGHTQHLSVSPKWRRRGLGRALLAESLRMMREKGLEEASLDVETQSTTGELHLYESMGYEIHRKFAHYAKQFEQNETR
ncbi:MAG TPA: N-acetyltransferase [Thermoplasmata archaeon]|jgi:ribosomal protein S18 acetylase RimI-like enzyme